MCVEHSLADHFPLCAVDTHYLGIPDYDLSLRLVGALCARLQPFLPKARALNAKAVLAIEFCKCFNARDSSGH